MPQRLPPFMAGLALLVLATTHRELVLWLVALAPLTVGFFEIYSKTLPANRPACTACAENCGCCRVGCGTMR